MHISNQIIDSFPLTYSPKSCDKEKLSIPLEAHHKAQSSEIFLSFQQKKLKELKIFYLLTNHAETAYLSVRNGKLCNAVRLVEFRPRKVAVHTFWGWSQARMLRRPSRRTIESHNFFVLAPILVKFHVRTRLIESFRTIFRTWWCGEEKLPFTPVHTLRQLKRDEALIPPLGRVVEF